VTTLTCLYCGSIVNPPIRKEDLTHCKFCNDYVHCSQNGGGKGLYKIQLIDYEFINMDLS